MRRTKPVSFLAAFDAPVMAVNCDRRVPSTTAPQSLMLMNSDFVLKQAGRDRPASSGAETARGRRRRPICTDRLAVAWQLAYQRPITPRS